MGWEHSPSPDPIPRGLKPLPTSHPSAPRFSRLLCLTGGYAGAYAPAYHVKLHNGSLCQLIGGTKQ